MLAQSQANHRSRLSDSGKHGNALSSVARVIFSSSCHLSDFVFVVICPPPALAWPGRLLSFVRRRGRGSDGAALRMAGCPAGVGAPGWVCWALGVVRLAGNLGGVSGGGRRERSAEHLEHLECSWQPHIQGRGAQKRTQRAG